MFTIFKFHDIETSWFRIFVAILISPLSIPFATTAWLADKIVYLYDEWHEMIENFIGKFEE